MADGLAKVQLPKDALSRINIGQSFAEYDKVLTQPGVFVKTPALEAALDPKRSRCFFVGRRGTGKTAITTYVKSIQKAAIQLFPQVFAPLGLEMDLKALKDTRQRPFRSLVQAFKRSIYDEVLGEWVKRHLLSFNDFPQSLSRERNLIEDFDFDTRTLHFFEEMLEVLRKNNEKDWLKLIKRPKELEDEMAKLREGPSWDTPVLVDRIDESWDGADRAVYILMALMHSCVEICLFWELWG